MADNLSVSLSIGGRVDRSLLTSINSTKASLAQLTQSLRQLREADKQAGNLRRMEVALDGTRKQLQASSSRYSELARAMRLVNSPSAELVRNFNLAKIENEKLKASFRSQVGRISELRASLRSAGVDTANLAGSQAVLSTAINNASVAQARLLGVQAATRTNSQALQSAYGELIGAGALGFGLKAAIAPAIQFEQAMADVAKVVKDDSVEAISSLSAQIIALSRNIPLAQGELASIAAAGARLGLEQADLPDFVSVVARMASAFDLLPEEAGTAIAKLSKIFEIPITNIELLGDAINELAKTGAREGDIVDVLTRVGGVASQFGLSANQTAALGTALLSLGKTPEVASTGINALLTKLQAADAQSKKFKDTLSDLGVDSVELANDIRENPEAALIKFLQALEELDEQSRSVSLVNLFGQEYADDISLIVGRLDVLRNAFGIVTEESNYLGGVQEETARKLNTTASQLVLLGNIAREAAINFGSALLPALKLVVSGLQSVAGSVADFAAEFPNVSAGIAGLVSGLVALRVATIAGRLAFLLLKGGVLSLAGVFARLGSLSAIATIASIGTTASTSAIGVGALVSKLTDLGKTASGIAVISALVGGTLKLADAMNQSAAAMKSRREAAEKYTASLRDQMEETSQFYDVERQSTQGLDNAGLADYSKQIGAHEEYWRARMLLEQESTGQATQLTTERWKSALEELRVLSATNAERESLKDQIVKQLSVATTAEQQLTANLIAQVDARKAAYDAEKAKIAEVANLRAEFNRQLSSARTAVNPADQTLATGTPIEALRALDAAKSQITGGDFEQAQASAAKTIELVKALSEAGEISKLFANQLLDQAALTGEEALSKLETQRIAQAEKAKTAIAEAQTQLSQFESLLSEREVNIKLGIETESLSTLRGLLQQYLIDNPVTLPLATAETKTTQVPGCAKGGLLSGPGTGTSDSILAMLSSGEFVNRAKAVKFYGVDFFKRLNALQLPKFADGGLVGKIAVPELASASSGTSFTVNFGADSFELTERNGNAEGFVDALKRQIAKRGRRR